MLFDVLDPAVREREPKATSLDELSAALVLERSTMNQITINRVVGQCLIEAVLETLNTE